MRFNRIRTYDRRDGAYHGRVIDGPYEGDVVSCDRGYFDVAIYKPLSVMAFDPRLMEAPTVVDHCRGVYQWSRSLSAWVFRW